MTDSDEELYRSYLKTGNEKAFRTLLERHREHLTLFLNGFVHNIDDAEDLMMDAFAVAASGTTRFRGKSSFKTWLYSIGRNLAISAIRKQRIRTTELTDDAGYSPPADFEMLQEEKNRQLYAALDALKDDYRQVLYLMYFEDLTQDEVSAIMKKSKQQVYHLASRGRTALKAELERRGFDYAQY
jgi:RNA polymerase sigma factor (sigma-70 family)